MFGIFTKRCEILLRSLWKSDSALSYSFRKSEYNLTIADTSIVMLMLIIIIIRMWKLVHVMKEKSPESLAGRFSHWGFQRSALGRLDLPSPLPCSTFTWWGWWWWQLGWNLLRPLETPSHDEDGDDDDVVVDDGDEIFSSLATPSHDEDGDDEDGDDDNYEEIFSAP